MTTYRPRARTAVRRAMAGLAPDAGPVAALMAARHLEWAAEAEVRDRIRTAREAGEPWRVIGGALGFTMDPAVTAFRFAEYSPGIFGWTCPSCGQAVTDRGPEAGGPAEAEQGHADECERFAATVAEWDAQWADDGSGEGAPLG